MQTNWWPEPDHGLMYQLIGPNGTIDTNKNTYSGPLGTTGVNLEVRAGGPAIGFQTVTAQEYQDDSILLGMGGTDEQIGTSADQPTVAVLAWYDKNPQVFFWGNPAWNFTSVADIKANGATVLAFSAAAYLDVLEGKGVLDKDQVDTSYTGDPSRFVAADGNIVSQGFVTAEPYIYENEVNGWKKPVKFLLLDKEVPIYQDTLVIRADKLDAESGVFAEAHPAAAARGGRLRQESRSDQRDAGRLHREDQRWDADLGRGRRGRREEAAHAGHRRQRHGRGVRLVRHRPSADPDQRLRPRLRRQRQSPQSRPETVRHLHQRVPGQVHQADALRRTTWR